MGDVVAWRGELVLAAATWSDKDGHKVKFKVVGGREGPNPFKYFTKRRKGKAGTRFNAVMVKVFDPPAKTAEDLSRGVQEVQCELMLANWSDSSTAGHAVEFWCPPPDRGMHVFEGFERGKDSFMVALAELDDDDEPIDQKARARVEAAAAKPTEPENGSQGPHRRQQRLSQVAALMCMNPDFKRWIQSEHPDVKDPAQWMRDRLQIESRAELDSNDKVAFNFHEVIRKPFAQWVENGGVPF